MKPVENEPIAGNKTDLRPSKHLAISGNDVILPDGSMLPNVYEGYRRYLAYLPLDPGSAIPVSELAQIICSRELESGQITPPIARGWVSSTIAQINKRLLSGTAVQITNAAPRFETVEGRKKRAQARYYVAFPPEVVLQHNALVVSGQLNGSLPSRFKQKGGVDELVLSIVRFQRGNTELGDPVRPSPADYLQIRYAPEPQRIDCAARELRGIVALTCVPNGNYQPPSLGLKMRVGSAFGTLIHHLGKDEEREKEVVSQALDQLSVTERMLMFESMSTTLKAELGYPDLDVCSEEQMAVYIRRAVYTKNKQMKRIRKVDIEGMLPQDIPEEAAVRLAKLIDACLDRSDDFQIRKVIEGLLRSPVSADIFRRMILAGNQERFLDSLQVFSKAMSRQ